jgi:membrane protein
MTTEASDRSETVALVAATGLLLFALGAEMKRSRPQARQQGLEPRPAENDAPAAARAEPGRGRRAVSPLQIPWRGWKDILWRTYEQISEDRLLAIAAGVVFYGLLAVFPAITALVSMYGLFADPKTIGDHLSSLAMMLPQGSFEIVREQIARVLAKGNVSLGATFLFGLALALWSANAGVKAMIDALNVVYEEPEKRGFFKLNAVSLGFTFGGIVSILLMVGAVVALPLILDRLYLPLESKQIVSLARWPLLFAMLILGLGVLYRFGPSRPSARG